MGVKLLDHVSRVFVVRERTWFSILNPNPAQPGHTSSFTNNILSLKAMHTATTSKSYEAMRPHGKILGVSHVLKCRSRRRQQPLSSTNFPHHQLWFSVIFYTWKTTTPASFNFLYASETDRLLLPCFLRFPVPWSR